MKRLCLAVLVSVIAVIINGSDGTSTSLTQAAPVYPLKTSANGRYLVDQNNVPFLITGDSPQALIVNLSVADADMFFSNRKAAGFNAVWIQLLCNTYTGGRSDGSTYDGIVPFTTPGDMSTPNEAYFSRVDAMILLAANYGITVFLAPVDAGGWLNTLLANDVTVARAFGQYIGNRYKGFDNIVWLNGNDFQTWTNPEDDSVVKAVALGIQDMDTRHIHTVELDYFVSGSLDDSTWAPIIQLNAVYTYYPTYVKVLAEYNRPNLMPTFLVEANYEFEHLFTDDGSPAVLRRQEYWTMLSGAAGQLYGNHYTWQFRTGWQSYLDTPGSIQMGYVKALFEPRQWYDLVPDQNHTFVTAGYGTFSSSGPIAGNDYATAAITSDGTLAMAYMPALRTITVNMSKLSGQATAQWYDPSNGAYTTTTGSPFANSGMQQFTPPGNNHDGSGDWVLVLTATLPQPPPATTTPTISTASIIAISATTATGGGSVISDGGATVTARGVCWSTSANPTTADRLSSNGAGTGAFTSFITGLAPNTSYHVRAYSTNAAGTAYGNEVIFSTTTTTAKRPSAPILLRVD